MARARKITGLKANAPTGANARKIVAVRVDEFFGFAPYLTDPEAVTQLHDMRIAAKRLRYALELFKDVLGSDAGACIDRIKAFQEIVGEIHDHDVQVGILHDHLRALTATHADDLVTLATNGEEDVPIATLKRHARAFVTEKAWVAAQTALAAAIARAMDDRRARYASLLVQWDAWQAENLRARLDALAEKSPQAT